ncbi:MAG: dolichol-phosphate mannosyltransferase, partial [Flavobacteriaceae bacterium]|nr:dolichol-phosphate mannosyltransferase [Flavobacteriaceae bacterium]
MTYQLTVIVPIFNEEENLERVEKELNDYLKIATKKTKYLLVND